MSNYIKTIFICITLSISINTSAQELFGTYKNSLNNETYSFYLSNNKSYKFSLYFNAMAVDKSNQRGGFIINEDQFISFRYALDCAIIEYKTWIKRAKKNNIKQYSTPISYVTRAQAFFKTDTWNVDLDILMFFNLNISTIDGETKYLISLNTDYITAEGNPDIKSNGFVIAFNSVEELVTFSDQLTSAKISNLLDEKGSTTALLKNKDLTQEIKYPIIGFGLKLNSDFSLGMNDIQSSSSEKFDARIIKPNLTGGFSGGISSRIEFKKWYIQPEILYSFGGKSYYISCYDHKYRQLDFYKKVSLCTMDIPLLVGYKVWKYKRGNLRVYAGPKLRLDMGSKINYVNLIYPQNRNVVEPIRLSDLSTVSKPMTFGINTGIEFYFEHSSLGLSYNFIGDMYQTQILGNTIDNTRANTLGITFIWNIFDNQKN